MDYKYIDFPMLDNTFSIYGIKIRVGRHENLFILFLMAIKITGSAQKYRVGRVSGNTFFFGINAFGMAQPEFEPTYFPLP